MPSGVYLDVAKDIESWLDTLPYTIFGRGFDITNEDVRCKAALWLADQIQGLDEFIQGRDQDSQPAPDLPLSHPYTTDRYVHGAEIGPPCLVCGGSRKDHYVR